MTLNIGFISLFAALIAPLLACLKMKRFLIPVILFSTPLLFNIVSLFVGQSDLFTGYFPPYSLFHTRLALVMLPLAVMGYILFANMLKRFAPIVLIVLGIQLIILFKQTPITLKEAQNTYFEGKGKEQQLLASRLHNNPTSGLILISGSANDTLIFDAHIPLKQVIYEGSGKYWQQAKNDPTSIAQRIIVSPEQRDSIWKVSQEKKDFFNNYTLVYSGEFFRVYDLEKNDKLETIETVQPVETVEKLPTESSCDYVVQVGDSLWRIAKNKLGKGNYFTKIIELNKDTYFDLPIIHPDQKIVIPCS
jgi:LysM repeat protein